jgi:hypothetical protein
VTRDEQLRKIKALQSELGALANHANAGKADKEQRDLRDRLASMAMNGLLANQKHTHRDTKDLARFAYEIADEMIQPRAP